MASSTRSAGTHTRQQSSPFSRSYHDDGVDLTDDELVAAMAVKPNRVGTGINSVQKFGSDTSSNQDSPSPIGRRSDQMLDALDQGMAKVNLKVALSQVYEGKLGPLMESNSTASRAQPPAKWMPTIESDTTGNLPCVEHVTVKQMRNDDITGDPSLLDIPTGLVKMVVAANTGAVAADDGTHLGRGSLAGTTSDRSTSAKRRQTDPGDHGETVSTGEDSPRASGHSAAAHDSRSADGDQKENKNKWSSS